MTIYIVVYYMYTCIDKTMQIVLERGSIDGMPNTYACKGVSNPNVLIFPPRFCTLVLFIVGCLLTLGALRHRIIIVLMLKTVDYKLLLYSNKNATYKLEQPVHVHFVTLLLHTST